MPHAHFFFSNFEKKIKFWNGSFKKIEFGFLIISHIDSSFIREVINQELMVTEKDIADFKGKIYVSDKEETGKITLFFRVYYNFRLLPSIL